MDLSSFLLGRGDFKTADEILQIVNDHPAAASDGSRAADALLIFQTTKQQTWLVASPRFLACVLDDRNKGFTRVQWILPAGELVADRRLTANIRTTSKSDRLGRLSINERKDWLFSKRLFTDRTIEATVRDLITRTMIGQNV